jgi:hypothetical protein
LHDEDEEEPTRIMFYDLKRFVCGFGAASWLAHLTGRISFFKDFIDAKFFSAGLGVKDSVSKLELWINVWQLSYCHSAKSVWVEQAEVRWESF